MITAPGIGLAAGLAVLLAALTWAIDWTVRGCATGAVGINRVLGLRLPAMMASERAWKAGHAAAARLLRPVSVGVSILLVISVALSGQPIAYLMALGLSVLAIPVSVVASAVRGARVARGMGR